MVVLGPPRCYEDDDHRVRAISTSAVMRTSQGCRHGLRDRSFLSDPREDRSHRFVGDTESRATRRNPSRSARAASSAHCAREMRGSLTTVA
jgi:hypothetical protein